MARVGPRDERADVWPLDRMVSRETDKIASRKVENVHWHNRKKNLNEQLDDRFLPF